MTLNFPTNPALDATYEYQGIVYTWDGEKWDASAPLVVGTNNLVDGSVTTPKIADDAVTEDKISLVGGSVVGYQQGLFLPDVKTQNGTDVWVADGVIQPGASELSRFSWWRIGQAVTVSSTLVLNSGGTPGSNFELVVNKLPYQSKAGGVTGSFEPDGVMQRFSGTAFYHNFVSATNSTLITPQIANIPSMGGSYDGVTVTFALNKPDAAAALIVGEQVQGDSEISFSVTYLTEDTTWQPLNGATVI